MNTLPIIDQQIQFMGPAGTLIGYFARPVADGLYPSVVVIHENQGLTAHIQDIVRRFAQEGFLVLAPDALSLLGGTPADGAQAIDWIKDLDDAKNIANFQAGVDYLKAHNNGNGRVGSVGFCWGGRASGLLAVHSQNLDAGVIYYGKSPASEQVVKINCPILMHYGAEDAAINATVVDFEVALTAAGKTFTKHVYAGAGHAFYNDTRADRYHAGAAAESWPRTVAFLRQTLA